MGKEKPPTKKSDSNKNVKTSFSRLFDSAMIETRMIDAIVQADGWTLAEFTAAPPWLRQLYNRHAVAACRAMHAIEAAESVIKPSEQP